MKIHGICLSIRLQARGRFLLAGGEFLLTPSAKNAKQVHGSGRRPDMNGDRKVQLCLIILLAWLTGGVLAGSLTPPGSPASTQKPLVEVEPRIAINSESTPGDVDSLYRITEPGSYYLMGNLTGESGKSGIEIAASHVTIDLMGFIVAGVPESLSGITSEGGCTHLVVRNGAVSNWAAHGVLLLSGTGGEVSLVEDLRASGNGAHGIRVNNYSEIRRCTASDNISDGLRVGQHGMVAECTAVRNGQNGITADKGSRVSDSVSLKNMVHGISVGHDCDVSNSTARLNEWNGINTGVGCTIQDCWTSENSTGIYANIGTSVISCKTSWNVYGIEGKDESRIMHCTSFFNASHGIFIVENRCLAVGNVSYMNGHSGPGAGIASGKSGNHLEGNNCILNDWGIVVTGPDNVIVRNTCRWNTTNFEFAENNRYGEIVDLSASSTPAVLGNSAANTLGSTDPWPNFAY
jgi:hypothetical protein